MLEAVGLCAERPTLLWGSPPKAARCRRARGLCRPPKRPIGKSRGQREEEKEGLNSEPEAPGGKQIENKSRKVLGGDCKQSKVATLTSLLS